MRNRVVLTATLTWLLATPGFLLAQSPTGTPGKVGVINIQAAIANTAEGKAAMTELQKKYAPRQQDLQKQGQDINALQDQLQRQGTTLSDDERARLSRQLEDKQKIFKRAQEDAESESQADSQDTINRIGQKMIRIIVDYAEQNGYSLVIDDARTPVYYAARQIDITDEIVKRYDAANPAAATGLSSPAVPSASSGVTTRPAATPAPRPPAATKPATPTTTKPAAPTK